MGSFFFSGSHLVKLDGKNRFVLPKEMRFGLMEDEGKLECSIGLGLGGCLTIYRKSDVDKIVARFQAKQHIGRYQKFFTLFFSTLHQTECDKVGRIAVPPILKKTAGIQTEIVVAGVLNKIELWPKDRYEADLHGLMHEEGLEGLSAEAFALLGEEVPHG
jgi:MraZ protein